MSERGRYEFADDGEKLGVLAAELIELGSKIGQWIAVEAERETDAKAGRRYADSNMHRGRRQGYEVVIARLSNLISDYDLIRERKRYIETDDDD